MSNAAQVESLELLQKLKACLARFGVDAQAALGTADGEIRRVQATLDDRLKYWQQQVFKRTELVNVARSNLVHARAIQQGKNVGTVEQELALRKAQEQLKEAEGKVVTTKKWQRELPNFVKDFEGPARGLGGFVEADLRQAVAVLDGRIAALEAYLALVEREST